MAIALRPFAERSCEDGPTDMVLFSTGQNLPNEGRVCLFFRINLAHDSVQDRKSDSVALQLLGSIRAELISEGIEVTVPKNGAFGQGLMSCHAATGVVGLILVPVNDASLEEWQMHSMFQRTGGHAKSELLQSESAFWALVCSRIEESLNKLKARDIEWISLRTAESRYKS